MLKSSKDYEIHRRKVEVNFEIRPDYNTIGDTINMARNINSF